MYVPELVPTAQLPATCGLLAWSAELVQEFGKLILASVAVEVPDVALPQISMNFPSRAQYASIEVTVPQPVKVGVYDAGAVVALRGKILKLEPSLTMTKVSFSVYITTVVDPPTVSEAFPSIVTVLVDESILIMVSSSPLFPTAVGRVIVMFPLVASQRRMSSEVVAV